MRHAKLLEWYNHENNIRDWTRNVKLAQIFFLIFFKKNVCQENQAIVVVAVHFMFRFYYYKYIADAYLETVKID